MPAPEKIPTASSNPFYGCAILVIMMSIMGGIVCWVIYSGLKQNEEIGRFAVDNAEPLPVVVISAETQTALERKLEQFKTRAKAGEAAELKLTVDELNGLIALSASHQVADYRGMVRFLRFDAELQRLYADVWWPLNRLSIKDRSKRYLVGVVGFEAYEDASNGLDLRVAEIDVPDRPVSGGFLAGIQQWPWLNLAKVNAEIKEVLMLVKQYGVSADGQYFWMSTEALEQKGEKE